MAAQLNVADHLAQGPRNAHELAHLTGANAAALGRVMRALCALGVFAESNSGYFSLNAAAQLLRSDVPGSFRAGVLFLAGEVRWRCWSDLPETVKTGVSASERLLGMQLFDFYAAHPEESELHDDAIGPSLQCTLVHFSAQSIFLEAVLWSISVGERVSRFPRPDRTPPPSRHTI